MPILFQGPSSDGFTTAAAMSEVPLNTFEEEEASGAPTDGLVAFTPTAAFEQAVTSVSVNWHPSLLTGRGQHPGTHILPGGVWRDIDWIGKRCSYRRDRALSVIPTYYLLAVSKRNFLRSE
jgi:hypothetical protein